MNGPTNLLGQPVKVGDLIAITTTSGKWSRTRIAKVMRIESVQDQKYDYSTKTYVPHTRFRTFVKLYNTKREYDRTTNQWSSPFLKPYVKEVFGVNDSVPLDPNMIPTEILEVLR
jgi:hypothetical protein